jgi:hypothetical protein
VDRESGVIGLDNGVGDLGGGDHGESGHHAVWKFFANLGDEQGTHAGTGTTAEGVGNLKALKAVAALSFTANDIENLVDQLSTLSVVTLGPVVSCELLL